MRGEYESVETVRRLRWWGWALSGALLLGVVLALGWKIAEVSERRAMQATREHLATSLTGLVAEQVAAGQVLAPAWRERNPFVLLRWRQDNYCGELAAGEQPRSGCWYWLPARAWVLYRPRFGDGWTRQGSELHAYRLLAVPEKPLTGSRSTGSAFALELEEVSSSELAALGWFGNEGDL